MAGNGKYSSQSDQNYWSRMKTGKSPSKKRGLAQAGKLAGFVPDYGPKPRAARPVERFVMAGAKPSNQAGLFLHILRCEEVLIELTSKLSEVVSAKERISPRLNYTHGVLNPITGKVSLVTARNTN